MTPRPWLRPGYYAIVGVAVGAFIVILVSLLVQVNSVVDSIRENQAGNRSLLTLITDCSDPDGRCYREQAARGAAQSGAVNATTIAAAYCASKGRMDTYAEALRCVQRLTKGNP